VRRDNSHFAEFASCLLRFAIISVFFIRAVVDWCASLEKQDLLPKQKLLARPKVHLQAALRQCPRSPGQSARPRLWRTNKSRTRTRPRFRLRSRPRLRFRVRAIPSELPRFFFKGPKVNSEFRLDGEIQVEPGLQTLVFNPLRLYDLRDFFFIILEMKIYHNCVFKL